MTNYNNVPDELKELDQWVCAFNDSKVPMRAYEYVSASSTNEDTWSKFEDALACVNAGFYDYCGFVFNDNGYVGIDIDNGFDEDGFITPDTAKIIQMCSSYTEKSKSGRGVHIIVKGSLPFKGKNNLKGIEIYRDARYFIITGETVMFKDIKENQKAIDYIVENYFSDIREEKTNIPKDKIYIPEWDKPVGTKFKLRPNYTPIPDGTRNISLTSIAGSMYKQGYSKELIYKELQYVNKVACTPPLSNGELQSICNSVTRYKR